MVCQLRAAGLRALDCADQLNFEHAQHGAQVMAAFQDASVHADDSVEALAIAQFRAFLDPVDRVLGAAPEDREDRNVAQE